MPNNDESLKAKPPDPYVGRVIDKYTLLQKLGHGGMGLVYLAEQVRIKRRVAVKLLPVKLINDEINVKRIEREAAAMGNLRHPNIATFHDFGISPDGQPYLVMEYITGKSFGELLDETKRLPPPRVMAIMSQVASAMDYAHKQGIIHRDLKPDNIMLDTGHAEDFVKVLDFGIAKSMDENMTLTQDGMLVGSPLYMSPEQCKGDKLTPKTDIYSFGVIMYSALTGVIPCKGSNIIETIGRKTLEQAPPFPPELSGWKSLERLTLSCLATQPSERPETMGIIAEQLDALLDRRATNSSIPARPESKGGREASKKNMILIGAACAIGYVVVAGVIAVSLICNYARDPEDSPKPDSGNTDIKPNPVSHNDVAPKPDPTWTNTNSPPKPAPIVTPPISKKPTNTPPAPKKPSVKPVVKTVQVKPKKPTKPTVARYNNQEVDDSQIGRYRTRTYNYQQPANNYQVPVHNYQQPVQNNYEQPTVHNNYEQPIRSNYHYESPPPVKNKRSYDPARYAEKERQMNARIQQYSNDPTMDPTKLEGLRRRARDLRMKQQAGGDYTGIYSKGNYYGNTNFGNGTGNNW